MVVDTMVAGIMADTIVVPVIVGDRSGLGLEQKKRTHHMGTSVAATERSSLSWQIS